MRHVAMCPQVCTPKISQRTHKVVPEPLSGFENANKLSMPPSLLSARNLGRQVDGASLWQDLSFSIVAGDSVALVGASGSGKTLLLRTLSLLDPIQYGEVLWRDSSITEIPLFRSRCIYHHQRSSLPNGTVEEVLRQPFSLRQHADRKFDSNRIIRWLKHLDRDEHFLQKQVAKLSGGETQITSLLRALQLAPNVMLFDEPTSALDRSTALQVEQLIKEWLAESHQERAYVWVSHDAQQSQRIADQHWSLQDGAIVKGVPAEESQP